MPGSQGLADSHSFYQKYISLRVKTRSTPRSYKIAYIAIYRSIPHFQLPQQCSFLGKKDARMYRG